jgi:oligopeptide/dipeptide ABC transporter ATP-binding protein
VVLRLLDRLRRELGMAYLFVSHDLNVVRLLCSRVLVMNQGKIVEEGPAERLLTQPSHPYTASLIAAIPHLEITAPSTAKPVNTNTALSSTGEPSCTPCSIRPAAAFSRA